jgi:branched-chain amino acid transport system permease protein
MTDADSVQPNIATGGTRATVLRATRESRLFGLILLAVLIALASLPAWGEPGTMRRIAEMASYLALAQLWNLLAGYAGLVSVGQQAYVGLGGYALFALTSWYGMHPLVALALAGVFSALIALPVSLAVFRLRGAYFAVGTWVVAEICQLFIAQLPQLGGGSGFSLTPAIVREIAADRASRDRILYELGIGLCVLVTVCVYLLLRSRHGLALTAIRDSERASRSLGVDTERTKRVIYVASAALTGLIGAYIFLLKLRISPEAGFSVNDWTVVVIFMVVIGGIGTLEGPIVGLLLYFGLREWLADYGTVYLILLGLVAIAVMLKAQQGLWGTIQARTGLQLFPLRRTLRMPNQP